MHDSLSFLVDVHYSQEVQESYTVEDGFLVGHAGTESPRRYDASTDASPFYSLLGLVRRKHTDASALGWVSEYGFLTVAAWEPHGKALYCAHNRPGTEFVFSEKPAGKPIPNRESVDTFWREAKEIASLWHLYRIVVNRQYDELVDLASISQDWTTSIFWEVVHNAHANMFESEMSLGQTYQLEAFRQIIYTIPDKLQGMRLETDEASLVSTLEQDRYEVKSSLRPITLLQTMYLQFYLLLNDRSKKICGSCNRVFTPARANQIYCSATCKSTAKNRRWRDRQRQKVENTEKEER